MNKSDLNKYYWNKFMDENLKRAEELRQIEACERYEEACRKKANEEIRKAMGYKSCVDEEMKKFTEGFAYKPPQKWQDFSQNKPNNCENVWVSNGQICVFLNKWGEADLDNYERGYVWQYAYPPELPEKKKEKKEHECIAENMLCRDESGAELGLYKKYLLRDEDKYEFICHVDYCPFCAFSLEDKE